MRDAVAFIPARGGSKRLPRKNVAQFYGRPLLAHSIDAALECARFDRVVVSSDDDEILAIAHRHGAEGLRRSADLASDAAGVVAVVLEFLDQQSRIGHMPSQLCCLYPAAPLRFAQDIAAVMDLLEPSQCDFALAVSGYAQPPHQALRATADGLAEPMFPDLVNLRDEVVGDLVVDNGSTYAVQVDAFRRTRSFYGRPLRVHRMPLERSVDINYPVDLELAAFYYQRWQP